MFDSIFTDRKTADYVKVRGKLSGYPHIRFVERPIGDLLVENYYLFTSGAPQHLIWKWIREKSRGGDLLSKTQTEKETRGER